MASPPRLAPRAPRWLALATLAVGASGCGLVLDLDPPDPVAGFDAGPRFDGAPGDAGEAVCGDGVLQGSEECELGDEDCVDCRLLCDCPDIALPCLERIDCVRGECVPVFLEEGEACTRAGVEGQCSASRRCIPAGCGDGVVALAEQCDDMNDVTGDGCEEDCTFSCQTSADCSDGDACNGEEACEPSGSGQRCVNGEPVAIRECEICDPDLGPVLPDEDGDGFADDVGQPCLDTALDCDDEDRTVNPGAIEVCNGEDDDCDSAVDEGTDSVECGNDVDGDGYPGEGALTMALCGDSCPADTVPIRTDASGNALLDCWDVDDGVGPLVNPAQTAFFEDPFCAAGDPGCPLPFDYDCDGREEPLDTRTGPDCDLLSVRGCRGDGWVPPVPSCGTVGIWAECNPFLLLTCRADREDRVQACR